MRHIGIELDLIEGKFFDRSEIYLICSTHSATFARESVVCTDGPCKVKNLQRLKIEKRNSNIFLRD